MHDHRHDPIAAIATAPGRGGVGIVRISSGADLGALAQALCGRALPAREACYVPFGDAAGQPIEAVEQNEELTFSEWVEPGDKFALRVSGESMIDEHIADGDYVIIRKQEQARDGQIVAVRDDDGEATLKRFFRERNRIRLEPANRSMKPIFRDRVNILGILVGVVRKY